MMFLIPIALATLAAAGTAGALWYLAAKPWRAGESWHLSRGWILGLLFGIYVGCAVLDVVPRWPPREDWQRLLLVLVPLTALVETIITVSQSRRFAWLLRAIVAASIAPIMLHQSTYLADLAGPGSAEWTTSQAIFVLATIALLIAAVWVSLAKLQEQTSDQLVSSILALVSGTAGLAVLMSGYLRGGMIGLVWAAALAGNTITSFRAPTQQQRSNFLGIGLLGVAAVLLMGRFFGALATIPALIIFAAPSLAWLAELRTLRSLTPARSSAVRLLFVAASLLVVLTLVGLKFLAAISQSDPLQDLP